MKKIISTSDAPAAIGPYSQAIRSGDFLFCSGQIPLDPKSGQMVSDDIAAQTRRVLDNISGVLKSEGLSLGNVLKTTIFLTDLGNFQIVNEIYGSYFSSEPPARSTVQVSALPKGAKIEIEVIALRKSRRRRERYVWIRLTVSARNLLWDARHSRHFAGYSSLFRSPKAFRQHAGQIGQNARAPYSSGNSIRSSSRALR